MKFRTLLNRPKSDNCFSPPGSPIKDEHRLVTEPDGNTRLEKIGEIDIDDYIQSFKNECNIHNIVARALGGDPAALQVSDSGIYADLTILPKDIHEAYHILKNAEAIYTGLSPEVRLSYGNFENFLEKSVSEGMIRADQKFMEVNPDAIEQPGTIQSSTTQS